MDGRKGYRGYSKQTIKQIHQEMEDQENATKSQGGKEMNKQRKVVITTTYNEMGIIIDTKAEEVAQPTIEPRKKGKWVYGEDEYGIDGYHCDKCGFFLPWDYAHTFINYIEDYNFCPSCGADMRQGEGDEANDSVDM